ncbi:6817_t:CDS:1 [Cetraspora pellucida]|uniref:6817_t:CDS:1 n=1 Tax=Cetraspora pellucida TaxID=1433469 RepID=A0A9N9G5P7_9GLOM|nr:6817_t:CDS:1 [Cetraspora pellucida]
MDTQNIIVNADESKYCSRCKKTKPVIEFTKQSGGKTVTFTRCNLCNEQDRKSRQNARAVVAKSTSSSAQSRQNARAVIAENTSPLILNYDESDETGIDNENNEDELFYDFGDLEELVSVNFKDSEEKNNHVKFSIKVKIERELVNENILLPEFDQNEEAEKFHKIINIMIVPLQTESGYYWELQYLYVNKKNGQYIGCATAHLGCTQKLERKYKKPDEQPVKRVSEVHSAIECYPCHGTITIKIDLCEQMLKYQ